MARCRFSVDGSRRRSPPMQCSIAFAVRPREALIDCSKRNNLDALRFDDRPHAALPVQQNGQGSNEGNAAIRPIPERRRRGRLGSVQNGCCALVRTGGSVPDRDRAEIAGILAREGQLQYSLDIWAHDFTRCWKPPRACCPERWENLGFCNERLCH